MTNAWLAFNSIFYFCEQILTPDVFKEIKHICTVILGNSSTDISKKELVQTAQGGYYKPQVQCAVLFNDYATEDMHTVWWCEFMNVSFSYIFEDIKYISDVLIDIST